MSAVRPLVDVAGRPRSPATMPGFHAGRAPRNKGQRYPADPPTVDEIVAVMRQPPRASLLVCRYTSSQHVNRERARRPASTLTFVRIGG